MKTYNSSNFFKHTFCEFKQVHDFKFPENSNYKSKSESIYFYTNEGVYRKSNHWGRVANCRWKLIQSENYKNQNIVVGFAKWTDFYPINSSEKIFYIDVNFENQIAKLQPKRDTPQQQLFAYSEAQKRIKQIHQLYKNDNWANYYDLPIKKLRVEIISKLISSDKNLNEIKNSLKITNHSFSVNL